MIETNCYLCGSIDKLPLFAQEGVDPYLEIVSKELLEIERCWYVCKNCGFVFRSPVLDEKESVVLYDQYEKDVFRNTTPDEYFDKIVSFPSEKSENTQKSLWLKECLEERFVPGKIPLMDVLDVGCGGGTLLYALGKVLGVKSLHGVELNEAYAGLARRRTRAEINNEPYLEGMFGKKFDLIICAKVLEHVSEPFELVKEFAKDLSVDGYVFIEVPDIVDIFNLPANHERFYIPHIYYFSKNTLSVILNRVELEVVSLRTIISHRNRSYLQVLARKSDGCEIPRPPYDDFVGIKNRVFPRVK